MQRSAFRNGVPISSYNYRDYDQNPSQPVLPTIPGQVQPVPGQPGQPVPGAVAPGQPAPGYFLGPGTGLQPGPGTPAAPANRELPGGNLTSRPAPRRN